ncbi:MAG: ferritin [Paraclostridium sp.]
MALSKEIISMLNIQMTREYFNEKLYQSMEAYFRKLDLPGFAHWMHLHAEEERTHANKIFKYIDEARAEIEIGSIDKPMKDFKSVQHAWEVALKAEELTSMHIKEIADKALEEKDHSTYEFIQWFVKEQIEEEDRFEEMLNRVKLAGAGYGVIMIDQEAAKR